MSKFCFVLISLFLQLTQAAQTFSEAAENRDCRQAETLGVDPSRGMDANSLLQPYVGKYGLSIECPAYVRITKLPNKTALMETCGLNDTNCKPLSVYITSEMEKYDPAYYEEIKLALKEENRERCTTATSAEYTSKKCVTFRKFYKGEGKPILWNSDTLTMFQKEGFRAQGAAQNGKFTTAYALQYPTQQLARSILTYHRYTDLGETEIGSSRMRAGKPFFSNKQQRIDRTNFFNYCSMSHASQWLNNPASTGTYRFTMIQNDGEKFNLCAQDFAGTNGVRSFADHISNAPDQHTENIRDILNAAGAGTTTLYEEQYKEGHYPTSPSNSSSGVRTGN